MKRLTTDTPQDNLEVALNLFYIKDHETWVRGGGPGPEYEDISLFDFTRLVAKKHIPDVELPADNDDLSMMMPEWLCDGSDTAEGIIALLYTAAWAYAELRHRLAAYEDTGLEPEAISARRKLPPVVDAALEAKANHIRDLLQAEREARLVVLPCIPAPRHYSQNSVYIIEDGEIFDEYVYEAIIGEDANGILTVYFSTLDGANFRQEDIGKTVFRTEAQARAALETQQGTGK